MNNLDFHWMGEWVNFAHLIRYYRTMARSTGWNGAPQRSLYNDRCGVAIAERRRQLADGAWRQAA